MVVRIDVKPTYFRVYLETSPGKLMPVPLTPCVGNVEQRYILPIAVAVEHDGSIRIGYDAMQRRKRAVGYCGAELRQYLTRDMPVRLGRCEIPAKELFEMLFVQMKACAEMMDESYIEEIYLIFSEDYNPAERELLMQLAPRGICHCKIEESDKLIEIVEPLKCSASQKASILEHWCDNGCWKKKQEKREEAIVWYRKAAVQGYAEAQFQLGCLYEDCYRLFLARQWYQKAASQGHQKAKECLRLFEDKESSYDMVLWMNEPSHEFALGEYPEGWWYLAACNGHPEAQVCMGNQFYEGSGFRMIRQVEQNRALAKKWYQRAAAQGNQEAIDKLRTLRF